MSDGFDSGPPSWDPPSTPPPPGGGFPPPAGGYPPPGAGFPPPGGGYPPPPPGGFGPPAGGYGPPKPDSNLVWAILTTLFCCLPFGVVAIVNAAKVDSAYAMGNFAGAQEASDKAKRFSIVSAAAAAGLGVAYLIFAVALVGSDTSSGY